MATATFVVRAVADGSKHSFTVQVADPAAGARFPGDPGPGKLVVGTSYGTLASNPQNGTPDWVEGFLGIHPMRAFRFYREAADSVASVAARAKDDAAKGRLLCMSKKIPGNDHAGLAAGKYDGLIDDNLGALADPGKPTLFILHHEPENDGLVTKDYVNGQHHVAELLKSYPTIGFTTAAMGGHYNPNTGGQTVFTDYYPDPSIYPIFGFDQYEQSFVGSEHHHTVDQLVGADVQIFRQHIGATKPIALFECGVRVDPALPGYAAKWLAELIAKAPGLGIAVLSYFFSDRNSQNGPWGWTNINDERTPVLAQALAQSAHAF